MWLWVLALKALPSHLWHSVTNDLSVSECHSPVRSYKMQLKYYEQIDLENPCFTCSWIIALFVGLDQRQWLTVTRLSLAVDCLCVSGVHAIGNSVQQAWQWNRVNGKLSFQCFSVMHCLFVIWLAIHDLCHGDESFSVDLRAFTTFKTDVVSFSCQLREKCNVGLLFC